MGTSWALIYKVIRIKVLFRDNCKKEDVNWPRGKQHIFFIFIRANVEFNTRKTRNEDNIICLYRLKKKTAAESQLQKKKNMLRRWNAITTGWNCSANAKKKRSSSGKHFRSLESNRKYLNGRKIRSICETLLARYKGNLFLNLIWFLKNQSWKHRALLKKSPEYRKKATQDGFCFTR